LKKHLIKDFLSYIVRKVRSIDMEVAKVTAKGQITIPRDSEALKSIQNSMEGEAEKAGFNDPDDVVKYIKSRRKNKGKIICE
jgi:bifunctional DNA-binding transcriptional regulator/antitoxin component of YhaV-PrlF toxin-antitoxin module